MKTRVTIERTANGVKVSNDKGHTWTFVQSGRPDASMRSGIAQIAASMLCGTIAHILDNVDSLEMDLEVRPTK